MDCSDARLGNDLNLKGDKVSEVRIISTTKKTTTRHKFRLELGISCYFFRFEGTSNQRERKNHRLLNYN
jgi:hypothetical protein